MDGINVNQHALVSPNLLIEETTSALLLHMHIACWLADPRCQWDLVCRTIKRYCAVADPNNPPSMQVSLKTQHAPQLPCMR
jgi:hypothetical protein